MRPLIISDAIKGDIRAAVERARSHPLAVADVMRLAVPTKNTVTLADRRPEHDRPQSEHVAIPFGYHLAVSFEEQPAGMCLHLSVSVERKHKGPNPFAFDMIAGECLEACGAQVAPRDGKLWLEEFLLDGKPGGLAINAVYLLAPAREGRA